MCLLRLKNFLLEQKSLINLRAALSGGNHQIRRPHISIDLSTEKIINKAKNITKMLQKCQSTEGFGIRQKSDVARERDYF